MYFTTTIKVIVQKMMLIAPSTSVSVGVFPVNVEENTYKGLVPTSPYTTPTALYTRAKVLGHPFFCSRKPQDLLHGIQLLGIAARPRHASMI